MIRAKTRKRRPLLILLLILALIPIGGVVLHRFVPPLFTVLMVQQAAAGHGMDYRWRSLDHISPRLVEAVIAAEDARFCQHHGFDVEAIQKAMEANERAEQRGSDKRRGASTISQQTAKNVFLWPSRDWVRKGLEVGYTGLIEAVWGKRRIMEMYLNVAEWAPGVYGAEAASRHWFNKNAENLTAREAARLAAILPSPRRYRAADPGPYVRRQASRIQAAMGTVRQQGLDACVDR
ncbi:monofunctional biosynthetic peptidoglycan transglycosylase [Brevundimonas sp. P7753]|uniref:monofunctional biosynthetic peptidoglycan transglycosylase n=1 Tax=Brevundimonas sp. P7753 TaxID=2726982 RepID=UPI0015B91553|nr:monofunctional biosynthetic peptidoglycan transglycosylase [Brevundimonas sp. P7753]NWE51552.1 monofunctional biosynthetic peptidoglycan transglycosylase [Brevundimonas sp. P7753]